MMLARILVFILLSCSLTLAQNSQPLPQSSAENEKAEEIIRKAVEALGGNAYLQVRTQIGRGFYTTFQEGVSQIPARFVDYVSYPNRERTEFVGGGVRVIQTNVGDSGWLFDGATKTISDMKPVQIEDFKRTMRTSLENLLHGWWRNDSAVLKYVGRREAGLAKRNETVRISYPDGFWIEYEFGARDNLPSKIIYKRKRANATSDEAEETTEEERLAKPITIDGITAPWVIDHFSNGVQTSRINYESIEYNRPLADSLFAKPENVKALK